MDKVKCFLGIQIDPFQEFYNHVIATIGLKNVKTTIVNPEKYHLTLHFFGEIAWSKIPSIISKMEKIEFSKFDISFGKAGTFPENKLNKTRILHVTLNDGLDKLKILHQNIRKIAEPEFEFENREYTPHLTIARVRSGKEIKLLAEQWRMSNFSKNNFTVKRISLIESIMGSQGTRYVSLHDIECRE